MDVVELGGWVSELTTQIGSPCLGMRELAKALKATKVNFVLLINMYDAGVL